MGIVEFGQSNSGITWRLTTFRKYIFFLFLFLQVCLVFHNPTTFSDRQFNWFSNPIDENNNAFCDFSPTPNHTLIVNEKLKLKSIEFCGYIVFDENDLNNISFKAFFLPDRDIKLSNCFIDKKLSRSPPVLYS